MVFQEKKNKPTTNQEINETKKKFKRNGAAKENTQ